MAMFKRLQYLIPILLLSFNAYSFENMADIYNAAECGGKGAAVADKFNITTQPIYVDSEKINNHSGSVLMCLMYVCSSIHESIVAMPTSTSSKIPEFCQWWEKATAKIDIGEEMQDLKDYLALKDLEAAKHEVLENSASTPDLNNQLYDSIRIGMLEDYTSSKLACHTLIYAARNFDADAKNILNNAGCAGVSLSVGVDYVRDHLIGFCSSAEAEKNLCVANRYCRGGRDNNGKCLTTDTKDGEIIDLPYDLMGSSLIRYTTFPDFMVQEGAKRYIETIMASALPPNIDPSDIFQSVSAAKDGHPVFKKNKAEILAGKYNAMAMLSMVHYSLSNLYVEREIVPDSSEKTTNLKAKNYSLLGTIEVESTRRFSDPRWYEQINHANETTLIRELGNIYATQLMLNYKIHEHMERLEGLYAVRNAYLANKLIGSMERGRLKASEYSR